MSDDRLARIRQRRESRYSGFSIERAMGDVDELLDEIDRLREEVTALGDTIDEVDAERRAWDAEASRLRAGIKTHRGHYDGPRWCHEHEDFDLWALIGDDPC